ncbi:hypothetical protein SAMN05216229_102126 [Geopseudomonas sagittaria]|uniref:Uncharacterized protein n=1 Tax=Geopseudomonas sagittaria TaxID=1135990 RepID=A0A1I5Q062_9GAMM|nr:hypothetical protein [Pseudomonas sagittaria]SFP39622.1 hypothetical protein SAMN05216229_102126 [Pseudomonas sagittaria]
MAISDYPGDLPQLKRRQEIIGQGSAPAGIGLTPEQAKAQRDAEWRKGSIQRQQQFKQGVSDAVGTAAGSIASIPLGIGKALANANVYDRPFDYSTPAKEAAKPGATPRQQAGGIMAFDAAQRATDAGIAYDKQMRAMPRPSAPIPDTLKAPSGGVVASGGAGGITADPSSQQSAAQPDEQPVAVERGQFGEVGYGGIVGRVNADGVAEFSNLSGDQQAGAGRQFSAGGLRPQRERVDIPAIPDEDRRAMPQGPAGSRNLASGSNVRTDAEEFARLGSAANIGNGIGTFSQGAAGDAALAAERFERANAERAKTIDMLRQYEPSGISGNRGPMTLDDALQARLGLRQRESDRADRELRQRGIEAGMDRSLRERELTAAEQRNQLEGQRTQQEIEAGDMTLAQQRRVEELSARIADPATDAAERESLLRTYSQLTGKKLDSGTIKLKRASADPLTGAKTEEEYLADARTGRPLVDQGGQGSAAISSDQKAIAIRDNPQLTREQKVAQLKALGYN